MTTKTTDAATLAAAFGVTVRRIQQLATDGVLPKAGRGKYPLVECFRAYLAHALSGASAANEPDDLVEARRLLLIEQTRRERRQNDVAEGRLVPWSEAEHALQTIAAGVIQLVESLPGRTASTLAGMSHTAAIRTYLLDEVRMVRQDIADRFTSLEKLPLPAMPTHCPLCQTQLKEAA